MSYLRDAQPEGWYRLLEEEDGASPSYLDQTYTRWEDGDCFGPWENIALALYEEWQEGRGPR